MRYIALTATSLLITLAAAPGAMAQRPGDLIARPDRGSISLPGPGMGDGALPIVRPPEFLGWVPATSADLQPGIVVRDRGSRYIGRILNVSSDSVVVRFGGDRSVALPHQMFWRWSSSVNLRMTRREFGRMAARVAGASAGQAHF